MRYQLTGDVLRSSNDAKCTMGTTKFRHFCFADQITALLGLPHTCPNKGAVISACRVN